MIIVADSSPLISFAIIDKLDLLTTIFTDIFIPKAVYDEIVLFNKPYSKILKDFSEGRIKYISKTPTVELLINDIDIGESEAIALALELNIKNILIDDYKGRKIAKSKGLFPIGTIGTLIQAKNMGYINSLKPFLDSLIKNKIRISKNLYLEALKLVGEN